MDGTLFLRFFLGGRGRTMTQPWPVTDRKKSVIIKDDPIKMTLIASE